MTDSCTTSTDISADTNGVLPTKTKDESIMEQELKQERSRRNELEVELSLLKARASSPTKRAQSHTAASQASAAEVVALRTERDGYREILNILTLENPAIQAAAAANKKKSSAFPLAMIRLLEVMPHDARAQKCAKATEEVFELQIYESGTWRGAMWNFPAAIRKLPVQQPSLLGTSLKDDGMEKPPRNSVLTNKTMTRVVNLDFGYSLPQDGSTWEWVSGWIVAERRTDDENKVTCSDGWSYAEKVMDLRRDPKDCYLDPIVEADGTAQRPFRRRRWTRQRVLIKYPHASEKSLSYLRLLADNAKLNAAARNLTLQLTETKALLTKAESNIVTMREEARKEKIAMRKELLARKEELHSGTPNLKARKPALSAESLEKVRTAAGGLASTFMSSSSSMISSASKNASKAASSAFRKTADEQRIGPSEAPAEKASSILHGTATATNVIQAKINHDTKSPAADPEVATTDSTTTSSTTTTLAISSGLANSFMASSMISSFRKTSDDRTVVSTDEESTTSSIVSSVEPSSKSFDWKKLSRGGSLFKTSNSSVIQSMSTKKSLEEEIIMQHLGKEMAQN